MDGQLRKMKLIN